MMVLTGTGVVLAGLSAGVAMWQAKVAASQKHAAVDSAASARKSANAAEEQAGYAKRQAEAADRSAISSEKQVMLSTQQLEQARQAYEESAHSTISSSFDLLASKSDALLQGYEKLYRMFASGVEDNVAADKLVWAISEQVTIVSEWVRVGIVSTPHLSNIPGYFEKFGSYAELALALYDDFLLLQDKLVGNAWDFRGEVLDRTKVHADALGSAYNDFIIAIGKWLINRSSERADV